MARKAKTPQGLHDKLIDAMKKAAKEQAKKFPKQLKLVEHILEDYESLSSSDKKLVDQLIKSLSKKSKTSSVGTASTNSGGRGDTCTREQWEAGHGWENDKR